MVAAESKGHEKRQAGNVGDVYVLKTRKFSIRTHKKRNVYEIKLCGFLGYYRENIRKVNSNKNYHSTNSISTYPIIMYIFCRVSAEIMTRPEDKVGCPTADYTAKPSCANRRMLHAHAALKI